MLARLEYLFLCCVLLKVCVGLYVVEVQLFGYNNPTGRCYDQEQCIRNDGQHSCCDDNRASGCTGGRRCDSYFIYCLRPLGSNGVGCSRYRSRTSSSNRDDNQLSPNDFFQSMVLGLENPLVLRGLTETYDPGVQVYIEIKDLDDNPDELVDVVLINHTLAVGESTQRQTFNGSFGFVTMDLNITVFCVENFQEPDCTQCVTGFTGPDCLEVDNCVRVNCSGRGQCVDGADSFNCSCDTGFTGDTCQTNIDECVGVNCSGRGQCVDGVNSFTCDCNPGYSGTICDSEVPTVDAGRATGAVVGGVIGGLIAVAILAALLVAFALFAFKWINHKGKGFGQGKISKNGSRPLPGDNPIYDGGTVANESKDVLPVPLSLIKTTSEVDGHVRSNAEEQEREMDNPIYGTDDEEGIQDNVYSVPFEEQGQEDGHKFENPIYGDEDEAEGNTYSVPYDSSRPTHLHS